MKDDLTLKLAVALHASPGAYALLVGPGLSSAAGIPSGTAIAHNLIRRLAVIEGAQPEPDPETWYQRRFSEVPDYLKVVQRLATTPAERLNLLRGYFEPTSEEREQGFRTPTAAHRVIAQLVKLGYLRMILTTNYDQLIEQALTDEEIVPEIIDSEETLQSAMPYVHNQCTLIKLHGDYRNSRMKHSLDEIAAYSPQLNAYLDRVFDDFGLIICGWPAVRDTALRNAILRAPNRRFSTYLLVKNELSGDATRIIHHRRAEVIPLNSEEAFFAELQEKLDSLRQLSRPEPISTALAVATVKRYLADPGQRIRLYDFIGQEVEAVCQELASEKFATEVASLHVEDIHLRVHQYTAVVERLAGLLAAVAYHGSGEQARLLHDAIERIAQPVRFEGKMSLLSLQYFPALLLSYAVGLAALAVENYPALAAVLREPIIYRDEDGERNRPVLAKLNICTIFPDAKFVPGPSDSRTAASDHLYGLLRPLLHDYLPIDYKYDAVFNTFEYLMALTYIDRLGAIESPLGRFSSTYGEYAENWQDSAPDRFVRTGEDKGDGWALLQAGFFAGSITRFSEISQAHMNWLISTLQAK